MPTDTPNIPGPVPSPNAPPAAGVQKLSAALDELEARVKALTDHGGCYADIEAIIGTARSQLANAKVAEAQATYDRAVAAIGKAETSAKAEPLAWALLWIEVGYLVLILALGYLVMRYPDYWLWKDLVGNNAKAAWFGALGGVTIGIYGLYTHISSKDFDPTFRLWYICKPVMGAIFGWFVYLVYFVGVISAQAAPGNEINKPQLAFLIAFLAGFSERFTIKTIDRFMTVLTVGEDPKKSGSAKAKPEATPTR